MFSNILNKHYCLKNKKWSFFVQVYWGKTCNPLINGGNEIVMIKMINDLEDDNKEKKSSPTISSNFSQQSTILPLSSYQQTLMSTKLITLLLRSNFAIKTRISASAFFLCSIYLCCALCLSLTIELLLTNPKMYFCICLAIITRWFACHATDQKRPRAEGWSKGWGQLGDTDENRNRGGQGVSDAG